MEEKYTSVRIIDSKPRKVIVNETGNIINRNPNKEELKGLNIESYKYNKYKGTVGYTKEQLLSYLIQFYQKYGRPPTAEYFKNNHGYPDPSTYIRIFGSWSNALKLVGLDVESMVKKGIIETNDQKRRFGEMIIRDHFKNNPIDLAGENKSCPCDGICPNGKNYDVKGSKSRNDVNYKFGTNNKYKEEIEIYYLLGFNEDYSKLEYGWRIPGEIVEKDNFMVGSSPISEFDIEDMEEYNITDELDSVLREYGFYDSN